MKKYREQIQKYKEVVEKQYISDEVKDQTIKTCKNILSGLTVEKQIPRASYFDFLYEQSKFIKKRWWIFQGGALLWLWIWLSKYDTDLKYMIRAMGIFATVFVILIVPEIWKNLRNGAIEIEQSSYYTLRQICVARILTFASVDFVIVAAFLFATYKTTDIPLYDLVINFLLPINVSCCICFRFLYSRWEKSEYVAVLLCLIWALIWMMIVANDFIYQKIATPVGATLIFITFVYFIYCIKRSLIFVEKILEDYTYEVRI